MYHQSIFLAKIRKISKFFIFKKKKKNNFLQLSKFLCIAWERFRNVGYSPAAMSLGLIICSYLFKRGYRIIKVVRCGN